ncbi:class I SAM-dependent methyltransferase [Brevibacillus sp. SYSU BS000544]|uniref:class I SAM-dependent methyltransferase n=1 Tax=Brevibacillus sp. SYSU BS000544 TaxID=3416443 RepID=UPI003CE575C9
MQQEKIIWTDASIRWFVESARHTKYYEEIVKQCSFLFRPSMQVLDLGCGAGILSQAIAPHVGFVQAVDSCPKAVQSLFERMMQEKITNISCALVDWKTWRPTRQADVVIVRQPDLLNQLDRLKNATKQYIVAIFPDPKKENRFFLGNISLPAINHWHPGTLQKTTQQLKERNIPYHLIRISSEYGQYFKQLSDFEEFLEFYYQIPIGSVSPEIQKTLLLKKEEGYYLPEKRQSGIIIIKKEDITAYPPRQKSNIKISL